MTDFAIPLDELIAHRPPMRFIDRVVAVSDTESIAEAHVGSGNPLFITGCGVPAYAGIEMMAQTIAAIDGMKRKRDGLPPRIGFLLGSRRYWVGCEDFAEGACLRVTANMVFSDGAMHVFECRIDDENGKMLANAALNVFVPNNPRNYLDGELP